MMFFYKVAAVWAALTCVSCLPARADDTESKFLSFHTGDRCALLSAAMGEPSAESHSSTLGVPHSVIRWITGSRTFVATCVFDRLVSKRVCQSMSNC